MLVLMVLLVWFAVSVPATVLVGRLLAAASERERVLADRW